MNTERIVLTGFMGCGKSTVGALLARRLGWDFTDLDREIEQRDGRPVPQIFAESGESFFRQQETVVLREVLRRSRVLIALGGGAPETEAIRTLLAAAPATVVVFLHAPFALLQDRCAQQAMEPGATSRPLLADPEQALLRFQNRLEHYASIATVSVDTSTLFPEQVANHVVELLQPQP